ncbi:hypothetical protein ACVDG8_029150 [Mesorhizobium sp. ORM8.1]
MTTDRNVQTETRTDIYERVTSQIIAGMVQRLLRVWTRPVGQS